MLVNDNHDTYALYKKKALSKHKKDKASLYQS